MGNVNLLTKALGLALILLFTGACAGPTTPFGSVNAWWTDERSEEDKKPSFAPEEVQSEEVRTSTPKNIEIELYPKRQKLHVSSPFIVELEGVQASNPEKNLQLTYNGINVTKKMLKQSRLIREDDKFKIVFKRLYLPSNRYNNIRVSYKEDNAKGVEARFFPPSCSINDLHALQNTFPFEPPSQYKKLIELLAPRSRINPAMLAGIVAQESAFNPKAVSWAKAIGLTQVTPLAEQEIIDDHNHFPRYPNLNRYSYPRIKALIISGKVDSAKEWRLNPMYSLQGGLAYLKYLDDYWRKERNAEWIKTLPGDPDVVHTQVLLASYNSGAARVKNAIGLHKHRWLYDEKLKEAHKYVNRVFSYCYHFSHKDEIQTTSLIKNKHLQRRASL